VVVSTAALLAGSLDVGASVRLGWSREDAQILHET